MNAIHAFLVSYGLIVVYLGVIIEGESVLIAAGFLAHQGVMNPFAVFLAAFAGSLTGDQLLFYAGRYFGTSRLVQRQMARPLFASLLARVQRNPVLFTLSVRFIYGARTIGPMALGVAGVRPLLYTALNVVAAAIWAALFTLIGYLCGQTIEQLAGRLHGPEMKIAIAAAIAIGAVLILHFGRAWLMHRPRRQSA
jgi:membrane protein DedA with SNARE-associated domain